MTFLFDANWLVTGFVFFNWTGLAAQLLGVTKTLFMMEGEGNICNQIACLLNRLERDGLWGNKAADINISLFYFYLSYSYVLIWWSSNYKPIIFSNWPSGRVLGKRWYPLTSFGFFILFYFFAFSGKAKGKKGLSGRRDPNRPKSTRGKLGTKNYLIFELTISHLPTSPPRTEGLRIQESYSSVLRMCLAYRGHSKNIFWKTEGKKRRIMKHSLETCLKEEQNCQFSQHLGGQCWPLTNVRCSVQNIKPQQEQWRSKSFWSESRFLTYINLRLRNWSHKRAGK